MQVRHAVRRFQAMSLSLLCAQSRVMALMTVLSQHAPNEIYLSDDNQGLVYVRTTRLMM